MLRRAFIISSSSSSFSCCTPPLGENLSIPLPHLPTLCYSLPNGVHSVRMWAHVYTFRFSLLWFPSCVGTSVYYWFPSNWAFQQHLSHRVYVQGISQCMTYTFIVLLQKVNDSHNHNTINNTLDFKVRRRRRRTFIMANK